MPLKIQLRTIWLTLLHFSDTLRAEQMCREILHDQREREGENCAIRLSHPFSTLYYRVSHNLCNIWDTPFLGHILINQAALLRAEQAMGYVWFFQKKFWKFWFWSWSGSGKSPPWFSGSAWFAASSSSSWSSPLVFNILAWKPLHMVKMKKIFFEVRFTMGSGFQAKSWIPTENMNLNLLQTRLSLKTKLSFYLALLFPK